MITKTVRVEEDKNISLPTIVIDTATNKFWGTFNPHEHSECNIKEVEDKIEQDILIEAVAIMTKRLFAKRKEPIEVDCKEVTTDVQTIIATQMAEEIVK